MILLLITIFFLFLSVFDEPDNRAGFNPFARRLLLSYLSSVISTTSSLSGPSYLDNLDCVYSIPKLLVLQMTANIQHGLSRRPNLTTTPAWSYQGTRPESDPRLRPLLTVSAVPQLEQSLCCLNDNSIRHEFLLLPSLRVKGRLCPLKGRGPVGNQTSRFLKPYLPTMLHDYVQAGPVARKQRQINRPLD